MKKEVLDEREFELVNIIGAEMDSNQRDLSRRMEMSLGMVNMLIRRLAAKGYIRIEQLNKRKVQYILTPKGFSEKIRQSVKYTLKTLHSISLIKENLKKVIEPLYYSGERRFVILGKSDFARLIEDAIGEMKLPDCGITYVNDLTAVEKTGVLLVAKENSEPIDWAPQKTVDLIHELAKLHHQNDQENH